MAGLGHLGERNRSIEKQPRRVHDEKADGAVVIDLCYTSCDWLRFVLSLRGTVALIVDYAPDARFLIHLSISLSDRGS